MTKYRIKKLWSPFFSHWYYRLEKKVVTGFLWWRFINWDGVAGNQLDTVIPASWNEFEITETITELP